MERLAVGVIVDEQSSDPGLASAAARQPGWSVRAMAVDDPPPHGAAALVVDGWLRGGARPPGSLANNVANLRLVDRVSRALQTGAVLEEWEGAAARA